MTKKRSDTIFAAGKARWLLENVHELGWGFYRTLVWQTDEMVRERHEWVMPKDIPNGGLYTVCRRLPFPFAQTFDRALDQHVGSR